MSRQTMKKSSRNPSASKNETSTKLARREFVKIFPATVAASLAAPVALASSLEAEAQQTPQTPQRISKEMLHTAEQLIGLELTDAQEAMALSGVNGNLAAYEALRKIDVPLD